ncbi:MAG: hypothetical protein RMI56_05475 [Sulfolobales archaeon]|nr:hypothetical protein [Sulfolobales archaeon]MDW8083230.1 hypothetical protein [Sulfolobales archaeon]
MFIDVSKAKLPKNLRYLWVPHLLVKPSCNKNIILLDCFFSSTLNKDIVMVLLSRKIDSVKIEASTSTDYPILFSSGCSLLYYQKVLNSINSALKSNSIESLLLNPQDIKVKSIAAETFKTILKLLCFPEPPSEVNQIYTLLGLDARGKKAYFILGNKIVRSSILEEVLYGRLNGVGAIKHYL